MEFCDKHFYGAIGGNRDLTQLQTSMFELPVNRDPYFDSVKNASGPGLSQAR